MQVNDGVSIQYYSDRYAATIIDVKGKIVVVQQDLARRTDSNGMSEIQEYKYSRDSGGCIDQFSLRKNGRYVIMGNSMRAGPFLVPGRHQFRDYSF